MPSLKEQIVRELIDLLQRSPEGRNIDLGSLVIYLDEEVLGWLYGSTFHTHPLYEYCAPYTGWTEDQFQQLMMPLESRLHSSMISVEFSDPPQEETEHTVIQASPFGGAGAMAAAMVTGGFGSFQEEEVEAGFSDADREALLDLILECTGKTEVEDIIDPEKLRGFLEETINEMYEDGGCNLLMLWEILLDAPGVTEDMLIPAFLLMEKKGGPVPMTMPPLVQNLPAKMRQTMLAQITGAPPPVPAGIPSPGPSLGRGMDDRRSEPPMVSRPPTASRGPSAPEARTPPSQAKRPATMSSAKRKSPKAKDDKKRGTVKRGALKGGGEKRGVPKWLWITAAVVIVLSAGYYFFFLRTATPVFQGKVVKVSVSSKVLPVQEVRLSKNNMHVRVKSSFLSLSEDKRVAKAHQFWQEVQGRYRLFSLTVFDPSGKVLHEFKSR